MHLVGDAAVGPDEMVADPVKLARYSPACGAGERDAQGRVTHEGNIDASNSGVIGQNVKLEASGSVLGLVVAKHNNGYLWWVSKTKARIGIQHNLSLIHI